MNIYKITNNLNGKFYIGQEINYNTNYLGSGILINKAIKKYGLANFTKIILEENIESKQELDEREIYWIKFLDATRLGYNLASGGQGGDFLSQELKDKRGKRISEVKSGRKLSEEHKANIRKAFNEKKIPKVIKSINHAGEKNGFYGKTHIGDMSRFSNRKGITPTNAKQIIDENGNVYSSATEAAKQFSNPDTARRAISETCKGQRNNYRGIIFKFYDNE